MVEIYEAVEPDAVVNVVDAVETPCPGVVVPVETPV